MDVVLSKQTSATKYSAILIVLASTLINGLGQVSYKFGAMQLFETALYQNYFILAGILLYILSGILMIYALGRGELSVLYPFVSVGFIWVNLFAVYFFQETIGPTRWLGIVSIIIGISFVGRSNR